jgi:flagellar basal-body rod modification protein FlgD
MNGDLQAKISPHKSPNTATFNDAKVKTAEKAVDSTGSDKTSFKDLLMNSNDATFYAREAQKNGNDLSGAKTDAEFAKMLSDKANKDNLRKPQNELDKDSFLKLFVTQLQNQDPLNPDDSAQMAAQLAQFQGLEQMLNVNKNLEKMQDSDATSRAVGLINFVGKDIKLDSGKIRLENGAISSALFRLDGESVNTALEVRDSAGVVVHSADLGLKSAGEHLVEWNVLKNDGTKAASGAYTINVLAKDMNGNDLPSKLTTTVKVTGVDLQDSGGSFYTDMGKVRISEISSVGELGALGGKAGKDESGKGQQSAPVVPGQNASVTGEQPAADQQASSGDKKPATPVPATQSQPAPAATPVAKAAPTSPAGNNPNGSTSTSSANPAGRSLTTPPGIAPMMEIPVPSSFGNQKPAS